MERLEGMLGEALQYLVEQGQKTLQVRDVYEDEKSVHLFVQGQNMCEVREYQKLMAPSRHHVFATVEGFIEYLNSRHCENDGGVIFVGRDRVVADPTYRSTIRHESLTMRLLYSEEFYALRSITDRPVNVVGLYRLLLTKLRYSMPTELLAVISKVKLTCVDESSIHLDPSGIYSTKSGQAIRVLFEGRKAEGEQSENIPLDYEWHGRIWECWPTEFIVPLRLELQEGPDKKVLFQFHPERLETVMNEARLQLANELAGKVDKTRFTVHEGEFGN